MPKTLITCECMGSQSIDAEGLSKATGLTVPPPCSALCTTQLDRAQAALQAGDAVLCCAQEVQIFDELAEALDLPAPLALDLRDRAGWSDDPASKTPKMAALVADALLPPPPDKTLDVISDGTCLILGPAHDPDDVTLTAARQLMDHLGVTVLVPAGAEAPDARGFDVIRGQLRQATGAFAGFNVVIDGFQQVTPGGRGTLGWAEPQSGATSVCDILLDLRGDTPLFPAPDKRDGYLRADPSHPAAVAAAVLAASHLSGTFEKTLHIRTEPLLCAHSRAEQTGCTRCLDLCPTGAITPNGDHVSVDPMICAGCGACSAACPSGAISFDAPPVDHVIRRVQTLASAYLTAGGTAPRMLVHTSEGAEMIRAAARHGRGLPADVLPLELPALGGFGHAETLAALAAGIASVTLLASRTTDRAALEAQIALTHAIAGPGRIALLDTPDPEAMADALYGGEAPAPVAQPIRPMGSRRQITRMAARALVPDAAQVPLPEGAPYGTVEVNTDACTLCLSCVSLCPSGALGDNEDKPQLRFQEDACLQCGLCATICPEDALSLTPRLDLTDAALDQRVLHEEEPFACIECGALFGSRAAIEKVSERLAGHAMFGGDKLRMLQMCDTCRVKAQFAAGDAPFAMGERPRVRTTDDYLSKRRDH